jgi:flagellar protein FlbD
MIPLTRLNGVSFVLNCDLILSIESTPDTVISLTLGQKIMVREDIKTIISLVIGFRKKVMHFSQAGDFEGVG